MRLLLPRCQTQAKPTGDGKTTGPSHSLTLTPPPTVSSSRTRPSNEGGADPIARSVPSERTQGGPTQATGAAPPRCRLLLLTDVHLHTLTRALGPPGHDDLEDAVLVVCFQVLGRHVRGELEDALERAER